MTPSRSIIKYRRCLSSMFHLSYWSAPGMERDLSVLRPWYHPFIHATFEPHWTHFPNSARSRTLLYLLRRISTVISSLFLCNHNSGSLSSGLCPFSPHHVGNVHEFCQ